MHPQVAPGAKKVLIGNKCDEEFTRAVPTAEGEQLAAKLGIPFLETSCKTNHNVKEVILIIAKKCEKRVHIYFPLDQHAPLNKQGLL